VLVGLVTGVSFCGPFLAAAARGLESGGIAGCVALFLGFFLTTSLAILPALASGWSKIGRVMRSLGGVACAAAGLLLITMGAARLVPPEPVEVRVSPSVYGRVLPGATVFRELADPACVAGFAVAPDGSQALVGYGFTTTGIAPEAARGFGGPVPVMVGMDATGRILVIRLLENQETPSYFRALRETSFAQQFEGRPYARPGAAEGGVQSVSGATISSNAVINGVREAARRVAEAHLTDNVRPAAARPGPGRAFKPIPVTVVLLFFAAAVIGERRGLWRFRRFVLLASVAAMGFWLKGFVSIKHIVRLAGRAMPAPPAETFVLIVPALALALIFGRLFCGWICPFGALSEILGRLFPWKLEPSAALDRRLRSIKYVLLAAAPVLFVFGGAAALAFEPFGDVFRLGFLKEPGLRPSRVWLIVLGVLSLLNVRFYCKYICPAGAAMGFIARFRLMPRRRPAGCFGCRQCLAACTFSRMPASGPDAVTDAECLTCMECDACPRGAEEGDTNHEQPQDK